MIAQPAAGGPGRPGMGRGGRGGSLGRVEHERELRRWSETLAGIARTGLGFTDSLYERERFEEVLKVAADMAACLAQDGPGPTSASADELYTAWRAGVGQGIGGYVTPKVVVGAVVGNEQGELLLIQRADSGYWLYPTGWADVGYSAVEVAIKEVEEETGIIAEPVRLLAVLDGMRFGATTNPFYSIVFHLRAVGGQLRPHPLEVKDVGFFAEDNLPEPLAGVERWQQLAFSALRGEPVEVFWDRPRSPAWRPQGQ
jgi:ADP-ribose pyrophosphatase YjhB (NUDIX family)